MHETRNARVATHAVGTWKNTILEDSPMNFSAGGTYMNAAQITTVIHKSSTHFRISRKLIHYSDAYNTQRRCRMEVRV